MIELWFGLLCFLLTLFIVLDGWDIGAGVLHLIVARTDAERREVIAAIGPLWSWNEVWLVAAGGTFLFAFPRVMAVSFSGFYLVLWMALWSLILRGVSIEVGGHVPDRLWQSFWDFAFGASNVLLAVLFGAAFGNVIRGVPLDSAGWFSMSLFTDFRPRGRVGILDWYTVSVAIFATVLLAAHGATYLRFKTTARVHDRSEHLARRLWTMALVLFPVVSFETWIVRPELYGAMAVRPIAWLPVAMILAGAWAIWTGLRGPSAGLRAGPSAELGAGPGEGRAFAGSCAIVAGLLGGMAASVFPVMLHSTLDPAYSLTAYDGATAANGLTIALIWWPLAVALAATYPLVIMRSLRGKVPPAQDTQGS